VHELLEELARRDPRVEDVLDYDVHRQDLHERGSQIDEPRDLGLVVGHLDELLESVSDDVLDPDLKERIDLHVQAFFLHLFLGLRLALLEFKLEVVHGFGFGLYLHQRVPIERL